MDYFQPSFYHFSEDSLILSRIVIENEQRAQSCLELGSGCGVVGIEVANKISSIKELVLIEKQKDFLPFLEKNIDTFLRTNIECEILNTTFKEFDESKKFDIIVGNLPYFLPHASRVGLDQRRSICRHWIDGSFAEVLSIVDQNLHDNGHAYLITAKSLIEKIEGFHVQELAPFKSAALILVSKAR